MLFDTLVSYGVVLPIFSSNCIFEEFTNVQEVHHTNRWQLLQAKRVNKENSIKSFLLVYPQTEVRYWVIQQLVSLSLYIFTRFKVIRIGVVELRRRFDSFQKAVNKVEGALLEASSLLTNYNDSIAVLFSSLQV